MGIGMYFEFHPSGQARCRGQTGKADSLSGVQRSARVRQKQVFFGINEIKDIGEGIMLRRSGPRAAARP